MAGKNASLNVVVAAVLVLLPALALPLLLGPEEKGINAARLFYAGSMLDQTQEMTGLYSLALTAGVSTVWWSHVSRDQVNPGTERAQASAQA